MNKIISIIFAIFFFILLVTQSFAQETENNLKAQLEEKSWKIIDKTSPDSLNAYLKKYPEGIYSNKAKKYLSLFDKIEDFKNKKSEPNFIIPFNKLGENWKNLGKKGYVSFLYNREMKDSDVLTVTFWRWPNIDFSGIASGATGSFADMDFSNWVNSSPTGDGSIIGFHTNGEECPVRNSVVIVSEKDNIVYFGVIADIGLVHLDGKGKVIYPDDSVKMLK